MFYLTMEIEKLAKLARINLSSEEKEKLQKEFEEILGYISTLKESDTDETVTTGEMGVINVLRKDDSEIDKNAEPKNLIEMAPFVENGYVKVKHVFEN